MVWLARDRMVGVSGTTCRSPAAYTVTMLIEWLTEITG